MTTAFEHAQRMHDLAAFCAARLNEDEQNAQLFLVACSESDETGVGVVTSNGQKIELYDPVKRLAALTAERMLVAFDVRERQTMYDMVSAGRHPDEPQSLLTQGAVSAFDLALMVLGARWASHPAYQPEWSVMQVVDDTRSV